MAEKLKVFVAHSFDKEIPEGENKSDIDVATWFIKLMRKKPLGFKVITGTKPVPGPIDKKIQADIADCSCVIGIFSKRYYDDKFKKWLSSPFVLCECACAMGFYYNINKLICGFYEEGIDTRDLALITIGGLELISFKRSTLEDNKKRFIDYLGKIPMIVASGGYRNGQIILSTPPYTQQRLHKIYTIYRNGNVTVQNINHILISDAETFNKENKGQIVHEIWHKQCDMPTFEEMIHTPIDKRRDAPFLQGIFRYINQKKMSTPLSISLNKEEEERTFFFAGFLDVGESPIKFKNQDIIRYQYAWGILKAYATVEEELETLCGEKEIEENAYNQAGVISSHGPIGELILELRFERGKGPIFSKSPFVQSTTSFSDLSPWSQPQDMSMTEEEDHEMWFQTYKLVEHNFQGRIKVLWRPSSRKYFE